MWHHEIPSERPLIIVPDINASFFFACWTMFFSFTARWNCHSQNQSFLFGNCRSPPRIFLNRSSFLCNLWHLLFRRLCFLSSKVCWGFPQAHRHGEFFWLSIFSFKVAAILVRVCIFHGPTLVTSTDPCSQLFLTHILQSLLCAWPQFATASAFRFTGRYAAKAPAGSAGCNFRIFMTCQPAPPTYPVEK